MTREQMIDMAVKKVFERDGHPWKNYVSLYGGVVAAIRREFTEIEVHDYFIGRQW